MMYYDSQAISSQVVASAVIVWLIRRIKASALIPWVNENTKVINKTLAVVMSGIAAIGVGWNYTYSAADDGTLVFTITGLSFSSIIGYIKSWIFSYVVQQSGYRLTEPEK